MCLVIQEKQTLDLTHPLDQALMVSEQPIQLYSRPRAVQPTDTSANVPYLLVAPPILALCFDLHIIQTQAGPRVAQG